MIEYHFEDISEFSISKTLSEWIKNTVLEEHNKLGPINYIFCSDDYLLKINQEALDHDYYTDIITFDYTEEKEISGDLFISIERVKENAEVFNVNFEDELQRVMIHGVLHLCGYKDKSEKEELQMRSKEDYYLNKR